MKLDRDIVQRLRASMGNLYPVLLAEVCAHLQMLDVMLGLESLQPSFMHRGTFEMLVMRCDFLRWALALHLGWIMEATHHIPLLRS